MILNGEAVNAKESAKIQRYMEMIRKEAGISEHALIESENFVPTAAGLASSASAALAGACNEALQLGLSDKDLSRLARRGSGSRSRSIYGGFAEWEKGNDDETSFAYRVEADGWENELAMVLLLLITNLKRYPVVQACHLRDTSRFYQYWLDNVEPDLKETKSHCSKRFQAYG